MSPATRTRDLRRRSDRQSSLRPAPTATDYPQNSESSPVQLFIHVAFPIAPYPPPYLNFSTDLPRFAHHIRSSDAAHMTFHHLAIRADGARIMLDYPSADDAEISTADAPISGALIVRRNATLATHNSAVNLTVFIHNAERQYAPSTLDISTSNA